MTDPDTFLLPRTGRADARVTGEVVVHHDGRPTSPDDQNNPLFRWHVLTVFRTPGGWAAGIGFRSNGNREAAKDWAFAWTSLGEMLWFLRDVFDPLAGVQSGGPGDDDPRLDVAERWRAAVAKAVGLAEEYERDMAEFDEWGQAYLERDD